MTDTRPLEARIDIRANHRARLEPFVPAVLARFVYPLAAFGSGGPLGYTRCRTWSALCAFDGVRRHLNDGSSYIQETHFVELQVGRIAESVAILEGLGYAVVVVDHREDSPRWVPCPVAKSRLPNVERDAVDALDSLRCVRLIRTDAAAVETVAAVCRAYPKARIAVALESHELLRRFRRRLEAAFPDEPLGLYTSRKKKPGRVSVGLIRQFPLGQKGEFDLLVLPFAGRHLSDETLRIATSGQYRRILSFSPQRRTGDAEFDRRSLFVASAVLPEEHPVPTTTAVMLESPGSDPGRWGWALDETPHRAPAKGCGVIATETYAKENILDEGILIRATGTKWPLEIDWPWRDAAPGVIVDFRDDYHPKAARNAAARADHYRETSETLWCP